MNMNTMNALVYCENSNLFIRKPNGLEYTFENVDKPALGFDFDVLIYEDNMEVKIMQWRDDRSPDEQEYIDLSDAEKDMIENYIENSEPPIGHTIHDQHRGRLEDVAESYVFEYMSSEGFNKIEFAIAAAREGSNHPNRSGARTFLEYFDAVYVVLDQVLSNMYATREDMLKHLDHYVALLPEPPVTQNAS